MSIDVDAVLRAATKKLTKISEHPRDLGIYRRLLLLRLVRQCLCVKDCDLSDDDDSSDGEESAAHSGPPPKRGRRDEVEKKPPEDL
ncbi:hypothetical protein V5799_012188 [Amblyomma americanum]|uniref:Uncharacterized protein n=1 Tax=Amblyomma americanum TaxID=6943 RepID=A0AAQ4EER1_AMBAM